MTNNSALSPNFTLSIGLIGGRCRRGRGRRFPGLRRSKLAAKSSKAEQLSPRRDPRRGLFRVRIGHRWAFEEAMRWPLALEGTVSL